MCSPSNSGSLALEATHHRQTTTSLKTSRNWECPLSTRCSALGQWERIARCQKVFSISPCVLSQCTKAPFRYHTLSTESFPGPVFVWSLALATGARLRFARPTPWRPFQLVLFITVCQETAANMARYICWILVPANATTTPSAKPKKNSVRRSHYFFHIYKSTVGICGQTKCPHQIRSSMRIRYPVGLEYYNIRDLCHTDQSQGSTGRTSDPVTPRNKQAKQPPPTYP